MFLSINAERAIASPAACTVGMYMGAGGVRFTRGLSIKTINSRECAHVRNSNRAIKLAAMKSSAQLDSPFSAIFRPLLFPVLQLGSYFAEARKKSLKGDAIMSGIRNRTAALQASVMLDLGPLYCVIHSLESI